MPGLELISHSIKTQCDTDTLGGTYELLTSKEREVWHRITDNIYRASRQPPAPDLSKQDSSNAKSKKIGDGTSPLERWVGKPLLNEMTQA